MFVEKSELRLWLESPITKTIISDLQELKNLEIAGLVNGSSYMDHAKMAYTVGLIAGLSKFLEYSFEEIKDDRMSPDRM